MRDVRIFARTIGHGPDVLELHGGPGANHSSLVPYFDPLARGRRLRYFDQRGSGNSTTSGQIDLGWRSHVNDLAELIGFWQCGRVTILGHSWGGLLGLLYAASYPNDVARLALVAPAPITARDRESFEQRFAQRLADPDIAAERRVLEESGLRKTDPSLYRRRAFELSVMPYLRDRANAHCVEPFLIAARVREAVWRSLNNYDIVRQVGGLRVPSLVLHGRHDPIPLESSERIATMLQGGLTVFEYSGHLPFVEEPDRFVRVLDEFLPCESCHPSRLGADHELGSGRPR